MSITNQFHVAVQVSNISYISVVLTPLLNIEGKAEFLTKSR